MSLWNTALIFFVVSILSIRFFFLAACILEYGAGLGCEFSVVNEVSTTICRRPINFGLLGVCCSRRCWCLLGVVVADADSESSIVGGDRCAFSFSDDVDPSTKFSVVAFLISVSDKANDA